MKECVGDSDAGETEMGSVSVCMRVCVGGVTNGR